MSIIPIRSKAWNYKGSSWKLSRAKIEAFLTCPRCFYLNNKLGLKDIPIIPYTLNSAVDTMLKREFDSYRQMGKQHPYQVEAGIDAIPAKHPKLDEWRENFKGVQFLTPLGITVSGAIDDLWINSQGEYFVVDYKSTAGEQQITAMNAEHHKGYQRQMEIYQWLLRHNGLKVSNTGYFVYCTGDTIQPFNSVIEFGVSVIGYEGDDSWVQPTIMKALACLDGDLPATNPECAVCCYSNARERLIHPYTGQEEDSLF